MIAELLKMIEEVDPSDTVKLDEIDARVEWFINPQWHNDYKLISIDSKFRIRRNGHYVLRVKSPQYTRSRDALKAIRPDDYTVSFHAGPRNYNVFCLIKSTGNHEIFRSLVKKNTEYRDAGLPTEELAELHAILQAINYERGIKKN